MLDLSELADKLEIHEVTEDEMDRWVREHYEETHPETLVKLTFPEEVMNVINSDHHKTKDGSFAIYYDHYSGKWTVEHSGYVRDDVAGHGESFVAAASEYRTAIRRANEEVLFRGVEDAVNEALPPHLHVTVGEHSITLYEHHDGRDNLRGGSSIDIKGKTPREAILAVQTAVREFLGEETIH